MTKNAVSACAKSIGAILIITIIVLAVILLMGFAISILWNCVMPYLFGLKEIDIQKAASLFLLVLIFRMTFTASSKY
jgi:flagellar basal body-associated protein FliL